MRLLLPTSERRKDTHEDVLHAQYLVGLLPPGERLDKPYYRGDIYEEASAPWAKVWESETQGTYIERLRRSLKSFPDVGYLKDWLEVSTSLSRHVHLFRNPQDRAERMNRVHVTRIDVRHGQKPTTYEFNDTKSLQRGLHETKGRDHDGRIYVIEDLSSAVIELFGSKYNIDPHFFRSHVNDYMWNKAVGDGVERRDLDVICRKRSHFMLQYLRPRYYRNVSSFANAIIEAGKFNVLRQLDSDRSREYLMDAEGAAVCLMRAKLSLWVHPDSATKSSPIAILLVDPTPSDGYPLWGGYTSFSNWNSEVVPKIVAAPPRTSLFDDVVHWMCQLGDNEIAEIAEDPRVLAVPALKIMLSDWHHVIQYMTSQIGQIEWEIELPDSRKSSRYVDDNVMRKLHPWRRNMSLYRAMITDAIHRLYPEHSQDQAKKLDHDRSLQSLRPDFQIILNDIDALQNHISQLVSVATAFQSLDENRRAINQNDNVARLTYLATPFIPLSFVSGLLSMVPDVTQLRQTFWIFFVVAIPVTTAALVAADFLNLRKKLLQIFRVQGQ